MNRKHNFNAGPSILPLSVLEEAQRNLVDTEGLGLSVLEMSHRSKDFAKILSRARSALAELVGLPDTHEILFLQGGAHLQFAMVPLNLGSGGAYVNTGVWSQKAIKEAKIFGDAREVWSAEPNGFRRVPRPDERIEVPADAPFLHYTTNNTIYGTQWDHVPDAAVPLVADMSSDFVSRPIDVSRFGLIYAGAQKNAGPSGLAIVIGRKDLLRTCRGERVPTLLRYGVHAENDSLYNTPPTFAIYVCALVFEWLLGQGGLAGIERHNERKARRLYEAIDRRADAFFGHADPACRSRMNVTFRLRTPEEDARFLAAAEERGCIGLKGHRLAGGLRASIYNAMPLESVEVLAELIEGWKG